MVVVKLHCNLEVWKGDFVGLAIAPTSSGCQTLQYISKRP